MELAQNVPPLFKGRLGGVYHQLMYALVDCNNFFVSCERVINPKLEGKPVVILSNNDGCIVARSNEVKKLSVPMGAPYFKWKDYLQTHNVRVFSSNYLLYGDMSRRVMESLEECMPEVSIYSIDEAFCDVSGVTDIHELIINAKTLIKQWTGIPVSIGVGPTKTLAKAANELAKKHPEHDGLLVFNSAKAALPFLKKLGVGDLWGVGRAFGEKLPRLGVHWAADLLEKDDKWLKSNLGTPGLSLVDELRGYEHTSLGLKSDMRKSVIRSRSFGSCVYEKQEIIDAISYFADRAGQKLRKEGLRTNVIRPYFQTSRHTTPRYYASKTIPLPEATNDSRVMIQACINAVKQLFKPGFPYRKAGIACTGIVSAETYQVSLFSKETPEDNKAMDAYDIVREKFGSDYISLGRTRDVQKWHMKRELLSTSERKNISSVPVVLCR
jgi:DNA polymerase V